MVPFGIPIIIRHLIFRVHQRDHHFDNHPYRDAFIRATAAYQPDVRPPSTNVKRGLLAVLAVFQRDGGMEQKRSRLGKLPETARFTSLNPKPRSLSSGSLWAPGSSCCGFDDCLC